MTATPIRAVRIDDDRWNRLMVDAKDNGTTASETIRELIDKHLGCSEETAES